MRPKIVTDLLCGRVSRKTSLDLPLHCREVYIGQWAFLQVQLRSAAGRTVTSDRCSLSEETVEDLVKIRLNLAKLAEEERVCGLGEGAGRAAAAAVDVYRPDQDAEEEVLLEDSTESDSDEFDDIFM